MEKTEDKPKAAPSKLDYCKKFLCNKSFIVTVAALVFVFIAFYIFKTEIKSFAIYAVNHYGWPALFLCCWAADVIIQPIPSDVIVFGSTFGGAHIWLTAIIAGFSSAFGGATGFFLGKFYGPWRFRRLFGKKILKQGRDLFRKHGALSVFIAGVTPVPYSAVCWIAGIYKVSLVKVVLASWTSRTLRYLVVAWLGHQF